MQNWRDHVPAWVTDGHGQMVAFLDKRSEEMSAKEWRVFRGALELNPPDDLFDVAALTYHLDDFSFFFPAGDDGSLGRVVAEYDYGARSDVLPYLDFEQVGALYREEHEGVFIDNAYIVQISENSLDRLKMKAESICLSGPPIDEGWTAKLRITGPNGNIAWLRLPDYEEVNGGQADEVAPALQDVGAGNIFECQLLEAECVFPQIDLMAQYDGLRQLVFDTSNLGYAIEEYGREPYFNQKLNAALIYENCDSLNFAIDIIGNLNCYDFISDADAKADVANTLPEKHKRQTIIRDAIDYEALAADHYRDKGFQRVDGGFFKRNGHPFHYDYSEEPSQRAAATERAGLEKRLGQELDRCLAEFKEEISCWSPENLIDEANIIAATDAAYRGFYSDADFSVETMETLLRYENPLAIMRDAWTDCADPGLVNHVGEYLKLVQRDPVSEQNYGLMPEESGQTDSPEQGQQMG